MPRGAREARSDLCDSVYKIHDRFLSQCNLRNLSVFLSPSPVPSLHKSLSFSLYLLPSLVFGETCNQLGFWAARKPKISLFLWHFCSFLIEFERNMFHDMKSCLPLTSLNHISIVCKSVEKSLDFYQNVLGFCPIRRPGSFDFNGAW